jgi:CheY-like chemotaxis protein
MAELDENKEYKRQVARIIDVIGQLRQETTLEAITDEEGGTRYDIPEQRELEPADTSKILIVDDERMLRDMFVKSLSVVFPNLTIDTAADGREARDLFAQNHYGLIVMDLSMPVMNGEEAFEEIRQLCQEKSWVLPPFIFCTGFVVSENLQEVVGDQSVHACLTKPLEIADMVRIIQERLKQGSPE